MARVTFHLKRYNETTPQRVFALFHVGGKQLKLYTSVSVRPQDWMRTKQRVKASAINSAPLNDTLSEFARNVEEAAYRLQRDGVLTAERLKRELQSGDEMPTAEALELTSQLKAWIEESTKRQRALTIRNYRTLENHVKKYCENRGGVPPIGAIDKKWVDGFVRYLTDRVGLVNTSLWNILKTLKTFLRWAYENGATKERTFERVKRKDYHVIEPPIVRLNEKELKAIAALDLSDEPALRNARDLFLLQCSLGVRYSDLVKITASQVDGDVIRITTEKNRKAVTIPLLPTARKILQRDRPPHPISNQKLNTYLKSIAARAGLDSEIVVPVFKGTSRVDQAYPKHELVTTHTAKRTFVSMMIGHGVSIDTVMKVTGNSRSTIERYVDLEESEVRADLSKVTDLIK